MAEKSYVKALTIYYCGRQACERGHFFGPAVRTQYLLHYVVSGRGVYQVGGKSYPAAAGQGFLIKPGELTYYKADEEDPWSYMWVAFDGYEAAELLNACGIEYLMQTKRPREFEERMERLVSIFALPGHNDYEYLSLFYGMMAQLVPGGTQKPGSYDKEYFDKACGYIRNNYSYPITIADVAKFVGIDRTYLYKIFVARQSFSPKRFLLNTRVSAAKNMLSERRYSLTEIALSCGFKDSSSLCASFKKITGKTPKAFVYEVETNLKKN